MKKIKAYRYLSILAALTLTACQPGTDTDAAASAGPPQAESTVESTAQNENTAQNSSTAQNESAAQKESAAHEEGGEETAGGSSSPVIHEDKPDLQPLNVEITGDYDGEWAENRAVLRSVSENVNILDEGYEKLKYALGEYNENNRQEVKTIYTENLEWVKDMPETSSEEYYVERTIEIKRADERILSFWNTETSYLGGAHGNYYRKGANFDSQTGEALSLSDVVTDEEKLYEYVKESLKDSYAPETLFEDYEKTLDTMFGKTEEEPLSPLEWTMDREKLVLTFNPYVLGPWAAGSLIAEVPFKENPELIKEAYRTDGTVTAIKLTPGESFMADRNGDGIKETFHFETEPNEEAYTTSFRLYLEEESEEKEYYGNFSEAYLMESKSGHPYLYVEFSSDNDWRRLEILDLEAGEKGGILNPAGTCNESVYEHFISGSEQFFLYTRIDLLGTYMAYRPYHVGENGMPAADDEVYTIDRLEREDFCTIVSKREIPVWIDGKEERMPSGTEFTLIKAGKPVEEGETFAAAELSDGRRCEIRLTREKDQFMYEIDGVSEYDCFESLHYAG